MVKTDNNLHSISWQNRNQQQVDYYMNIPTNQNSLSILSLNQTMTSNQKEIYPWMNEKKHGHNKKISPSGKISDYLLGKTGTNQ